MKNEEKFQTALTEANKGKERINIAPTSITMEQQAQIERLGYYPKDGYFEKRAYVMPAIPENKPIVYADWKGGVK